MEPDMKEYVKLLLKRGWLIGGIVLLCCGATAVYDRLFASPVYEASIKLIVNTANQVDGLMRPDSNLITSNIMMIDTYKEIIATPVIMQKVAAKHPEFNLTADELIRKTRVQSSSNSQVMSVAYRDESPTRAVALANEIGLVFRDEIPQIMNVDNVTILSESKSPSELESISMGLTFKLALAFILSLIASVSVVFLKEYMDDTLKDEKDVRVYLDKSTLAEISRIKRSELGKTDGSASKAAALSGDPLAIRFKQQL
ncbi:lipopolysaccharide biosynthesis protein [Cohnella sp. LGH]|uniref:Capsular polysaccharide biosynthesis protein n=1 Tax=Cohnella phaseoli TaxID=456490 RepID=A0A3D9KEV9_9BACL|nr:MULTISPECIES: Wzz/FepE/Etk N-terminal domain-containing protein [Cohnella]QTH41270.1 lipopolysaccharide biosynthesis protein [Cohnella sp. LGH]RED85035.1 capsular polysaccharide biosynthesis protein [Cohnella phaseoli]